jgi:hypothetical protein
MGAETSTFWVVARYGPEDYEMRKRFIIRCSVKVDVAGCLRTIALIIYLLM